MPLLWHRGKGKSMIGKVKTYDPKKGYGFITGDDGREYFVPHCNVRTRSGGLLAGYTVEITPPAVGNKAYDVRLL